MELPDLPMSAGSAGDAVASLQRMLRAQGCYDDVIDGSFGDGTEAAVAEFQDRFDELEPTGICDRATWVRLADADRPFHDPEDRSRERLLYLQWPMLRGDDVEELQLRLSVLGFHSSRIDGVFGPETAASVGRFQRNTGLIEDRVCGPESREVLVDLTGRHHDVHPMSAVFEEEFLRLQPGDDVECGIGTSSASEHDGLGAEVGRRLVELGRSVRVVAGDAAEQAAICNDSNLEVFVHVTATDVAQLTIAYYGRDRDHDSVAGRRLAGSIAGALRDLVAPTTVTTETRTTIRLKRTRCPAVDLEIPTGVVETLDPGALAAALHHSLEEWRRDLGPVE